MASLGVLRESDDFELSLALQNNSALQRALQEGGKTDETRQSLIVLACRTIQSCLGPGVKLDPDPSLANTNWSQSCWLTPKCIVYPRSAKDVSRTIKILGLLHTPFSVRCGGLSPTPEHSSIADGVLIDLRELGGIEISADGRIASVGPGARWSDVFEALDPHGLTVVGPRLPNVGIGGFILGGGLSFFSGEYGLAADKVENFEIVLSDGLIVDANSAEHPDLFWALKGGGSNFGIVTRFDLSTVPIRDIWYSMSTYAITEVPEVLLAFEQWQLRSADPKSAIFLRMGLDSCTITLVYSSPAKRPPCFNVFYDIDVMEYLILPTNGTVVSLTTALAELFPHNPARHDHRAASRKNDLGLYSAVEAYWVWRKETLALRDSTRADATFMIQHVPKTLIEKGIEDGSNPLGLTAVPQQWWAIVVDWDSAKDDNLVRESLRDITKRWTDLAKEQGTHLDFEFMNNASGDQNPLRSYGETNLQRLRDISMKYDKAQVFQLLQKGGFLLSRA
ncbi:FAD-binding domain-containing protein [Mollisia scopiformis]|uniref:FAD-binding domain-containing protein n=1 Tax=Mollisia scopiformis TaxID=149040 RepID=A0A194XXW7_MOLSC|nr:FAD-binding domain-containing protein [Mollisia scopiformis]KUJ24677.1 FAD-binding domain-containing protein [Mollisia scopiformis]